MNSSVTIRWNIPSLLNGDRKRPTKSDVRSATTFRSGDTEVLRGRRSLDCIPSEKNSSLRTLAPPSVKDQLIASQYVSGTSLVTNEALLNRSGVTRKLAARTTRVVFPPSPHVLNVLRSRRGRGMRRFDHREQWNNQDIGGAGHHVVPGTF
jgi:hypothetical protein